MSRRRRIVIGIAAAVAAAVLVGVFAVDASLAATREREAALDRFGGERVEVCVAVRELAAGETLTRQDVELKEWLVDLVPEGAAFDEESVIGHRVAFPIAENEPILVSRLDRGDVSLSVPQGLVAVSVPATDIVAVGGAVGEGDRVDVYVSGSSGTKRLLSDVLVLATSASAGVARGTMLGSGSGSSDISWVTLAIDPARVEEVVAASKQGGLYFALPGEATPSDAGAQAQGDGLQPTPATSEGGPQ